MIANINGIDLFYEKTGEGRPLIMVHGNGEDHTIFREAAAVLCKKYTCYLVDSRSHGQSSGAPLHYDAMAQDMITFMEALDLENVIFYGFSDGGIVGLIAASRCSRITALITSGANISPLGVKKSLRLLFRVSYTFRKDPKIGLMLNEPQITDEMLKSISARTLVLAGSKDLIVPEETVHIAETIPNAELRILQGEGHGSYIVHKTAVAELIDAFVSASPEPQGEEYCKMEIFLPETHLMALQEALRSVDAGHIGNYDSCLSTSRVTGYWRPLPGTDPYLGTEGELSREEELKVEVTVKKERLEETMAAVLAVHPYEEPVINVIPLLSVTQPLQSAAGRRQRPRRPRFR